MSNGQGGLDWAGLPVVCAHLGLEDDVPALIDRLAAIKSHRPSEPDTDPKPSLEQE